MAQAEQAKKVLVPAGTGNLRELYTEELLNSLGDPEKADLKGQFREGPDQIKIDYFPSYHLHAISQPISTTKGISSLEPEYSGLTIDRIFDISGFDMKNIIDEKIMFYDGEGDPRDWGRDIYFIKKSELKKSLEDVSLTKPESLNEMRESSLLIDGYVSKMEDEKERRIFSTKLLIGPQTYGRGIPRELDSEDKKEILSFEQTLENELDVEDASLALFSSPTRNILASEGIFPHQFSGNSMKPSD